MKTRHSYKTVSLIAALVMAAGIEAFPQNAAEYGSPIVIGTLQSSSNFGKLRGTRFHSGVDIRTGGVEGKKITAIEDGYIYRIGVKPYGYGNVVYVAHPDGRISVYGHLSRFTPEVDAYVRRERYRRQRNDIDLFPDANTFPVKRGEVIGWSGNSGNSFGPHLHFEIREKGGEKTVNVLARGYYDVVDNTPPKIFNVWYYTIDTLSGVPVHTLAAKAATVANQDGSYSLPAPMQLPGRGYFVVETMDRKDGVSGSMATYRITLSVDGVPRIEYLMDGFTFAQNHYAKILSDYKLNRTTSNDVFRLAVLNDGAMPFYRNVKDNGILNPDGRSDIRIEVEDDNGNTTVLSFIAEYAPELASSTVTIPTGAEPVDCEKHYSRTTENLKVTIPSGALYESLFYTQSKLCPPPKVTKSAGTRILSDFYEVHRDDVPLQNPVILSFRADVPTELQDKVVIARVNDRGRLAASAAEYTDGTVTGKASIFGTWCVAADTTSPTIGASFKLGEDMTGKQRLGFKIADDLSGIASFSATVDGKWVMLEHDTPHSTVYHYFDDSLCGTGKTHTIVLTVKDGVGNKAVYTGKYFR